jgi:hypothetical protein
MRIAIRVDTAIPTTVYLTLSVCSCRALPWPMRKTPSGNTVLLDDVKQGVVRVSTKLSARNVPFKGTKAERSQNDNQDHNPGAEADFVHTVQAGSVKKGRVSPDSRRGENRELASRLCAWQIDIKEQ